MWVGTFHGLAHRLLRQHWQEAGLPESFQVLDSDDQLRLIKRIATALELGGWKLVERRARPADLPTLELYETASDPLDGTDVAAANPEKVRELAAALAAWRTETARTKLEIVAPSDAATTPEELERLRSLGYVQ